MKKENPVIKNIIDNKKAYFDYYISDSYEAGIILKGHEVKSIRKKKCHIKEAYVKYIQNEFWIVNMHISHYQDTILFEPLNPTRSRKLLLKKSEILKLKSKVKEKNMTLVPLNLYFKDHLVKLQIALAKGKKLYDKRNTLKEKAIDKDIKRTYKHFK